MNQAIGKGAVNGVPRGRVPRAERENQLLDVSEDLFSQHGYQGTAIEDIASAAGVTRPMIYNYFRSKDGIYLACLRRARTAMQEKLLQAAAQGETPAQSLFNAIDAYYAFLQESPGAWEILYGGGIAVAGPASDEARELRFKTVDVVASLLVNRVFDKDKSAELSAEQITGFAHFVSGGSEQLAKWWRQNPHIKRKKIDQIMFKLVWPALQPYALERDISAFLADEPA